MSNTVLDIMESDDGHSEDIVDIVKIALLPLEDVRKMTEKAGLNKKKQLKRLYRNYFNLQVLNNVDVEKEVVGGEDRCARLKSQSRRQDEVLHAVPDEQNMEWE